MVNSVGRGWGIIEKLLAETKHCIASSTLLCFPSMDDIALVSKINFYKENLRIDETQ